MSDLPRRTMPWAAVPTLVLATLGCARKTPAAEPAANALRFFPPGATVYAGLRKLDDTLAAATVRTDGTDVLVSATLQEGFAAVATLGVLAVNAFVSYPTFATNARVDVEQVEADAQLRRAEAEFGNVRDARCP